MAMATRGLALASAVAVAFGLPSMEAVGKKGTCPGLVHGTPPSGNDTAVPSLEVYNDKLKELDLEAVMGDITQVLSKSQECWPADSFEESKVGTSYGGLFIRLAWHCSGTYRKHDGVGGCGGGRQRFQPENSWDDNANLDKARGLLWPIKEKYGDGLSWGDLFILAGTTSILHYGGPVSEVCMGRIDDADGEKSASLGPGPKQAAPCPFQGDCKLPLGTSTIGLIYVNPEGYMAIPDTSHSALQVRDTFSRMGMNDSETVALIGGGHTFGASHGACPKGPGDAPKDAPLNPFAGTCGEGKSKGKGKNIVTSGIEGHWTTDPFKWDNEYFKLLNNYGSKYVSAKGPGGKWQWKVEEKPELMMMTTDLSLLADPAYKALVGAWAEDTRPFDAAFAAAWEKLTTQGASWAGEKKCWRPDQRFKFAGL